MLALGWPIEREALFQTLKGEAVRDITGNDPIHDVRRQKGKFAQPVDLPGIEIVSFD